MALAFAYRRRGQGSPVTNGTPCPRPLSQYSFCVLGHWSPRLLDLCWAFFILAYLAIITVPPEYSNFQLRIHSPVTPPGASSFSLVDIYHPSATNECVEHRGLNIYFTFALKEKILRNLQAVYYKHTPSLPRKQEYMSSTRLRIVVHVYMCLNPRCLLG